jgi:hypothetical protein
MIKFSSHGPTGLLIGLGLSRENVNRLTAGSPIKVAFSEVGMQQPGEILIYFGETETEMARDLINAGLVTPQTKITNDLKPKKP